MLTKEMSFCFVEQENLLLTWEQNLQLVKLKRYIFFLSIWGEILSMSPIRRDWSKFILEYSIKSTGGTPSFSEREVFSWSPPNGPLPTSENLLAQVREKKWATKIEWFRSALDRFFKN
jgi:hypothetical protein